MAERHLRLRPPKICGSEKKLLNEMFPSRDCIVERGSRERDESRVFRAQDELPHLGGRGRERIGIMSDEAQHNTAMPGEETWPGLPPPMSAFGPFNAGHLEISQSCPGLAEEGSLLEDQGWCPIRATFSNADRWHRDRFDTSAFASGLAAREAIESNGLFPLC